MKQLSLFGDQDKNVGKKKRQPEKPQAMFSDKEFFEGAKNTVMYPDWQGKMALEKQDPRTEAERDADRLREAQGRTATLDSAELVTTLQRLQTQGDTVTLADAQAKRAHVIQHTGTALYAVTYSLTDSGELGDICETTWHTAETLASFAQALPPAQITILEAHLQQ